jgi:hypothetical protein
MLRFTRWLIMRVSMVTDELGSVPPTVLVTATRQRILWTPANEDDITAAVERQRWRSRRETLKLELTQPMLLEASLDNYMDPYYTQNAHTVRRRTALYTRCMCNYKACTSWSFDTPSNTDVDLENYTSQNMFFSIFDLLCNKVSACTTYVRNFHLVYIQLIHNATLIGKNERNH